MSENIIIDADERAEALNITESFCVQAPAGSGKTELLTQRILKLLAQSERPEEILAFTFTRKAAEEMRNRLLESLINASKRSSDDVLKLAPHAQLTHQLATAVLEQNEKYNWQLLGNTQRLRITTIDAFSAYITSQLPITSEFGAQPETSTDMNPVYQKAVQSMLSYLDDNISISGKIATLLRHLDNNLVKVQTLLCNLLQSRDHWLEHIITINSNPEQAKEILSASLNELTEENLGRAKEVLAPYSSTICQLIKFAALNLDAAGDSTLLDLNFSSNLPESSASKVAQWHAIANFFLTNAGSLRKTVTIKNGFPAASAGKDSSEKESFKEFKAKFIELRNNFSESNEIPDLFLHLQQLPTGHYGDQQWKVISALTEILPFLVAHLDMELKSQGIVDYVKVSTAALDALGTEEQPTDLTMRLDYQVKHILVDEFQDTSSQQTKLLEKLTWGWQPGDGRTLFIVGDGMQSCYNFRNANVGLFLSARDNGIGSIFLNSLQLKANFRSDAEVVNWVNIIFSQAFPAKDDISRGAVSYSESHSTRKSSQNSGVETLLWVSPKEAEISRRQQQLIEADAVVTQVESISDKHPGCSVAILVRTRSHLAEIVPALRQAEIPWNASDIDSLASYSEIMDLLTLFKSLTNLADKTAWLALLRTPYIGLTLTDIHHLARQAIDEQCTLWQSLCQFESITTLSKDAIQRLSHCIPILKTARQRRQQQPVRDWLEGVWLLLNGPITLGQNFELANIEKFFQILAEQCSHGDINDIHLFEKKLNSVNVSSSPSADVALHIMTIHNAKGLEFDFVIVPGLDRTTRSSDKPLLIWKDHLNSCGEERLLLSLLNKKGELPDSNYTYLNYEAGLRENMENTRLLYIAITRAAKKVILLAQIKSSKDELVAPARSSLLANIWQQLEGSSETNISVEITNMVEELGESEGDAGPVVPNPDNKLKSISTLRLKSEWFKPALHHDAVDNIHPTITLSFPNENPQHNLVEKRIGDIIHYCLKYIVENQITALEQNILLKMADNWRNQLKSVCDNIEQLDSAIDIIIHNLKNCMLHPKASWLFNHSHNDSCCELSLSDYRHSYRQEYIIDRTFIDENNIRWIIDYKSSRKHIDEKIEDFLISQKQQYSPQLENYANLFRELEDRTVKTALFFTSLPYWFPVEEFC